MDGTFVSRFGPSIGPRNLSSLPRLALGELWARPGATSLGEARGDLLGEPRRDRDELLGEARPITGRWVAGGCVCVSAREGLGKKKKITGTGRPARLPHRLPCQMGRPPPSTRTVGSENWSSPRRPRGPARPRRLPAGVVCQGPRGHYTPLLAELTQTRVGMCHCCCDRCTPGFRLGSSLAARRKVG